MSGLEHCFTIFRLPTVQCVFSRVTVVYVLLFRNLTIQSLTFVVFFGDWSGFFRLICALEKTLVLLWGDRHVTRLDMTVTFRAVC